MKPKLAAILVIGLLTLSIVGTAVAAISQAVAEEPSTSSVTLGSYTNQIGDTKGDDESRATGAFKFVCPFH
ncbi:MAG: hypothetical protein CL902_08075 [Dehalococcoidia bacterium]|nr:hypothetical protein [Dehalococcoidia bacterium]|tara:strand:+ start:301 stop:513 length:213 start_codon:yes stop_codon:yes gene_type:complete